MMPTWSPGASGPVGIFPPARFFEHPGHIVAYKNLRIWDASASRRVALVPAFVTAFVTASGRVIIWQSARALRRVHIAMWASPLFQRRAHEHARRGTPDCPGGNRHRSVAAAAGRHPAMGRACATRTRPRHLPTVSGSVEALPQATRGTGHRLVDLLGCARRGVHLHADGTDPDPGAH